MDRGRSARAPRGLQQDPGAPAGAQSFPSKGKPGLGTAQRGHSRVSPPHTPPCPLPKPPARLQTHPSLLCTPPRLGGSPSANPRAPGISKHRARSCNAAPGPGRPPRPADASREPGAPRPGCFARPPPLKATHRPDLADPAAAAARFPARRRFRVPFVAIPSAAARGRARNGEPAKSDFPGGC